MKHLVLVSYNETTEDLLRAALRDLAQAEREAGQARDRVGLCGRMLAKERGAAFIRFEHLRKEFGQ